jgi:hypothetical protein
MRLVFFAVLAVFAVVTSPIVVAAHPNHHQNSGEDQRRHLLSNTMEALRQSASLDSSSAQLQEDALWYLVQFMPQSDLDTLPIDTVRDTVAYAFAAQRAFPFWGINATTTSSSNKTLIPWAIFLNDVLPYATLTEQRDNWRPLFFEYFSSHAPALTDGTITNIDAAVRWMNQFAWNIVAPPIVFNASGNPTGLNEYSPFEVMAAHYASCTGLSVFLVSCLRSIGIPARVAGTPHWNLGNKTCPQGDASPDCGNHDWVEVWSDDGAWSFVDERGQIALNTSWFFPEHVRHQQPNSLNHSIFATSYAPAEYIAASYGGDDDVLAVPSPFFPMAWDWGNPQVPAWDVTLRYLSMIHSS